MIHRVIKQQPITLLERCKADASFAFEGLKRVMVFGDCASDDLLLDLQNARKPGVPPDIRLQGLNLFPFDAYEGRSPARVVWHWMKDTGRVGLKETEPPALQYIDEAGRGLFRKPHAKEIAAALNALPRDYATWEPIINYGATELNALAIAHAESNAEALTSLPVGGANDAVTADIPPEIGEPASMAETFEPVSAPEAANTEPEAEDEAATESEAEPDSADADASDGKKSHRSKRRNR